MASATPRVQLLQDIALPGGATLPRGLRLPLDRALLAGRVLARVPPAYGPTATVVLESNQYRRVV